VRALAEAEQRALVSADAQLLNLILASDYVQITPNGDSWSRDDLVGTIVSGELKFETLEISARQPDKAMDVQVDCQTAIVRYRSKIEATFGSTRYRHEARHTNVYAKRDGRWLAVSAQLTAVGGFPPPGQGVR
jgi:ketosteroid isomerase-like protein